MVTEKEYDQLSKDYMSEESDDSSDSETIVVHKHPWRSESMCMVIISVDIAKLSPKVMLELFCHLQN